MGCLTRLRNLWRRRQLEAEIEEELRAHLEMATEDAVHAGAEEEEARRGAQLRFGNPVVYKERTMGAEAALMVAGIGRDARLALRQMKKAPGYAGTAIITLALGIGATTAIFTLVQQLILRSLPVAHPEQLWRIGDSERCCYSDGYTQGDDGRQNDWNLFSWEAYRLFRRQTPAFEDLAAFQIGEGNAELAVRRAGSRASAETRNGEYVSGNFFRTFGISAWRGRLFTDDDDQEGAPPVAVMSFHTWQDRYGSDPSIVGSTCQINGHAFTLIGVAPPGFFGAKVDVGSMPDLWLPLTTEPMIAGATTRLKAARLAWLDLIGRVKPGTDKKQLEAQLKDELRQWLASHESDMSAQEKSAWQKQTLHLTPGGAGVSPMRADYKDALQLLLLAASCVLLTACANVASLMLARGVCNRQEVAVCLALGSSRRRLIRKALIESTVLALCGGAAGLALAYAGARLILHLAFRAGTWMPLDAAPSTAVLVFAVAISVTTGMIFGVVPALTTSLGEPIEAMRGANRAIGGTRGVFGTASVQQVLVIGQVAVSIMLLSMAAMLGRSLSNREHQNFGFDPHGRYLVSIDPKISGVQEAQLVPLFREIEWRLHAIRGVRSVGAVYEAPPGGWLTHNIRIEGRPEPGMKDNVTSGWTRVTPGFFEALGDSIVMGRPINDADDASTQPVAVVNEAFLKKFFAKENPVGHHFGPISGKNAAMYEIVGVARNVAFDSDLEQPMYFLPEAQRTHFDEVDAEGRELWSHYLYSLVVWAPGIHPELEARVRDVLAETNPNLVLYDMQPYSAVIREGFAQQNMIATLTWLFGLVALLLSAVGLYGVTAYGVERRTSEIGLRMALGADRASVVRMVLRTALWQVGIGIVVGIPAAIAAGMMAANRLFGVQPWSPGILALATIILLLTAIMAAAVPARRAAAVDPMGCLRVQ